MILQNNPFVPYWFQGIFGNISQGYMHLQQVVLLKWHWGPIRTSGQVLNVITFLTKTKLSRQVRDILKKTKGVIISTIALHVLLASLYISQHGRCVQTSNNQTDPRGEKF